jgi:hypothetical protein
MFRITSELKLCGEKITNEYMLEKYFPHFMLRICSCSSNIGSMNLKNTDFFENVDKEIDIMNYFFILVQFYVVSLCFS